MAEPDWNRLFEQNDRDQAEQLKPLARTLALFTEIFEEVGFTREEATNWVLVVWHTLLLPGIVQSHFGDQQ